MTTAIYEQMHTALWIVDPYNVRLRREPLF
jgi:hypothetical protein